MKKILIAATALLALASAPVEAKVKAPAKAAPAPATVQIVGFASTGGGAATGVIRAPASGPYISLARSFLQKEEGLPKGGKAYWDPAGQTQLVSIGYGHQYKRQSMIKGTFKPVMNKLKL